VGYQWRNTKRQSDTNYMYSLMSVAFVLINAHGRAWQTNLVSISTASPTINMMNFLPMKLLLQQTVNNKNMHVSSKCSTHCINNTRRSVHLAMAQLLKSTIKTKLEKSERKISTYKRRQAKSQCSPSSLDISSFENVKTGIKPLFLSQKMVQKLRPTIYRHRIYLNMQCEFHQIREKKKKERMIKYHTKHITLLL
jgi:hypothetical protein